jgi:hypothetical protein
MLIYIQIRNNFLQAACIRRNRKGFASYAENVKRNLWMTFTKLRRPFYPNDKIKISKKAYIQSPEEERMLKAVRELNSGWKKSGSITQNLRYDSDNGETVSH